MVAQGGGRDVAAMPMSLGEVVPSWRCKTSFQPPGYRPSVPWGSG